MNTNKEILIFVEIIFLSSLFVIYNAIHVRIQHLENITDNSCGFSKEYTLLDTCLKWHKNYDVISHIQNGRDVAPGEMPWLALIMVDTIDTNGTEGSWKCSGVVLNENWLLSAAHCFHFKAKDVTNAQVLVGFRNVSDHSNPLSVKDFFIPDIYRHYFFTDYDIALIRLNDSIDFGDNESRRKVNGICLPLNMVENSEEEYALMAGFGATNFGESLKGLPKVGWTKIMTNTTYYVDNDSGAVIYAKRIPFANGSVICSGDSGGPLIQFVNGKAVLIGINIMNTDGDDNLCPPYTKYQTMLFTRVSQHIQWINETIIHNN